MNKNKVNGILSRMQRIQRELFDVSAEFGDVDNYFMTEIEDISNRIGRVREEIGGFKNDLAGAI